MQVAKLQEVVVWKDGGVFFFLDQIQKKVKRNQSN